MDPARKTLAAALAALVFAATAGAAVAQPYSLVGIWSKTIRDANGNVSQIISDQFTADGHLATRLANNVLTVTYTGVYQVTNNGASVQSRYDDFEPKQLCTLICSPVTPVFAIGQVGTSSLTFNGPNAVCFGADCYTRQQ